MKSQFKFGLIIVVSVLLLIVLFTIAGCSSGGGSSSSPPSYSIGGTVTGLSGTGLDGSGLVLQNNGGDNLSITSNGSFTFAAAFANSASYSISVLTPPTSPAKTCTVTNETGAVSGSNVTNIIVTCSPWTKQFGSTSNDYGEAIATDAAANVYVAGYTDLGDMDGSGPAGNAGSTDLFVSKYYANGNPAWVRQLGTSGFEICYGIASDAGGNVYLTGSTTGDLDGAGPGTFGGSYDAFVVKYDTNGNLAWIRQFSPASKYAEGRAIAADAAGNVYVTGGTNDDLDGTGSETFAGGIDMFVVKYDTDGNQQWLRQIGTATEEKGLGIAVGNGVYVTGESWGDLDGAGSGINAGGPDIIVIKYDTSGNLLWIREFGTSAYDVGLAMAADPNGNAYLAGYTLGDLDGAGPGTGAGSSDAFVAKYNTSGTLQWISQTGTTANDFSTGITVGAAGNTYVSGYTDGTVTGGDTGDLVIRKLDSTGTIAWSKNIHTTYTDMATGIAFDGTSVYMTGYTAGNLDDNTNASPGGNDPFIMKYDTAGVKQ